MHLSSFLIFICNFAPAKAQMAESVDALVSNTSGATHPGSSPGLGTKLLQAQGAASDACSTFFISVRTYSGLVKGGRVVRICQSVASRKR